MSARPIRHTRPVGASERCSRSRQSPCCSRHSSWPPRSPPPASAATSADYFFISSIGPTFGPSRMSQFSHQPDGIASDANGNVYASTSGGFAKFSAAGHLHDQLRRRGRLVLRQLLRRSGGRQKRQAVLLRRAQQPRRETLALFRRRERHHLQHGQRVRPERRRRHVGHRARSILTSPTASPWTTATSTSAKPATTGSRSSRSTRTTTRSRGSHPGVTTPATARRAPGRVSSANRTGSPPTTTATCSSPIAATRASRS